MKKLITILLAALPLLLGAKTVEISVKPCAGHKLQAKIAQAISKKAAEDTLIVTLAEGTYDFTPAKATQRELYISNHDQTNPKSIGLLLENASNVIIRSKEAEFMYDGRMLPVALIGCKDITLQGVRIDFRNPHISQVEIIENDTISGTITFRPSREVQFKIEKGAFKATGLGWEHMPNSAIPFEKDTRHILCQTGDTPIRVRYVTLLGNGDIRSDWKNPRLIPGTILALRGWKRPTPGIFVDGCSDINIENTKVHYAEGMGLLAQNTHNITLDGFGVCLRGNDDPRYFTTQADATHFSSCSGKIVSTNGLYEGMMDDAINVHGTYLKVAEVVDSCTVRARYMHNQTYGFEWGAQGDSVQSIIPETMDYQPDIVTIAGIKQINPKEFEIKFSAPLPLQEGMGIENLTRTPEVEFTHNIIRNNRARGALFSTPRKVVCSYNLFDHTSGSAILLCGDCMGWFETGACHDVLISHNRFVNALTSIYQFTQGIISIYPEIHQIDRQQGYFHSNIRITDNEFDTFDVPLLYAKSVSGLLFMDNTIKKNNAFPRHKWLGDAPIHLERIKYANIQ